MTNYVPNFDAMYDQELWKWWQKNHNPTRQQARLIFPTQPQDYNLIVVVRDLANYARNKSFAMGCRAVGQIKTALVYETACDVIYDRLPEYAKW